MGKAKKNVKATTMEQPQMKIVMHTTCEVCPQQCARGLSYLEQMKKPGAIGFGVPCILTLGKP